MNAILSFPLGRLRVVAWIEGITYLLLGITMPLKYMYDMPQPNYIIGMLHGVFFILYGLLVLQVAYLDRWKSGKIFWALLASLIPFGTFVAEYKLFRY